MIHLHLLEGGPILIKADEITIGVGPGQDIEYNSIALCRCGLSENKPFCDGAHTSLAEGSLPEELISADNVHESSGSMTPVE